MKPSMVLEGNFDSKQTLFKFPLRNYFDHPVRIRGIRLTEEPDRNVLVNDIQVGRNSQVVCSGQFRASILNLLPEIFYDTVPSGCDVSLVFDVTTVREPYRSRVTVEISPETESGSRSRHLLFPVGNTQVTGKLVELVVTKELYQALENRDVMRMFVTQRPGLHPHQEGPRTPLNIVFKNGRIKLEKPAVFQVGDLLSIDFEGKGASAFDSRDVVGIMEVK